MSRPDRGEGLHPFDRRFLGIALPALAAASAAIWAAWGWRHGLAFAAAALLVTLDFVWLARGVRVMVGSQPTKMSSASRRALAAFGARTLLLLLGLYAIIRLLSGVGPAVAAGICFPLIALALAGILQSRG